MKNQLPRYFMRELGAKCMKKQLPRYFITKIIEKITKKDLPKPSGRWNLVYCNNELETKIARANHDNCGPCGEYEVKPPDVVTIRDDENIPSTKRPK